MTTDVVIGDATGVAPVVEFVVVTREVLTGSIVLASSLVVIFVVNTGLLARKIVDDVAAVAAVVSDRSVAVPLVVVTRAATYGSAVVVFAVTPGSVLLNVVSSVVVVAA